jgi:hypothetical protein
MIKFNYCNYILLKATKTCATENTYPPKIFKNFHNKSYDDKPRKLVVIYYTWGKKQRNDD